MDANNIEAVLVWVVIFFIILSSFFISRKVYKTLKNNNNPYYIIFTALCFITSIAVITIGVFFVWFVLFEEDFSRR